MLNKRMFTILFVMALLGHIRSVSAASVAEPATLARAKELLAGDNPKAAVDVLESALTEASGPEKVSLLNTLREAYQKSIEQARTAGLADEAEAYLENLTILTRKLDRAEVAASAPPKADPRLAASSVAPVDPIPAPDQPARPSPLVVSDEPRAISAPTPEPAAAPIETSAPDLATADAAFVAKQYTEAGRIYAGLAEKQKLPANRRDHWAYCRSVEVARKINSRPATPAEWSEIDAEIARIRQLSPKSWVGTYLRKLADERSGQPRAGAAPTKVRGAQPRSDESTLEQPASPVASLPPVPRLAKPEELVLPRAESVAHNSPSGRWQVLETANFRIYHADQGLAEKVSRIAEQVRTTQWRRWGGSAPLPWDPRCNIYLFPDAKVFTAVSGQPESSPGFSTMGLNEGKVVHRLINLRVDHPQMLEAVLPHEITHVVLADFFRDGQIPRWADEGMAVLAEPSVEQEKRAADLTAPLSSGRVFKLDDVLRMDYPEGPDWSLYYAQSVSLTRYLVGLGTPAQFIDFLQGSRKLGFEAELKRVYKIDSIPVLQERWLAFAKEQGPTRVVDQSKPARVE